MQCIRSYKIIFLTLSFLLAEGFMATISAQEGPRTELRTNYTHQHYISKYRFWIRNDVGVRRYFEENPYTMLMLRPRAIIELSSLVDFHPTIDFRYSLYPELPNTLEIRTWQGVSLHWPDIGRFVFDHFYRFEQRFYWTEGVKEEEIGLRSRYRLRMRVPFNKLTITDRTYFMELHGEVFLPHDNEIEELFASLLRVGATMAYNHNTKWRYQLKVYFDAGRNTMEDERKVSKFILELSVRTRF